MTDWLLGTLFATSALIVLVLLVREPVRRHFGARVAYGLWLIPAARLLMPTITRTVERPAIVPAPIQPFVPSVLAEPRLLATVAAPDPSLVDQLGGGPLLLTTLWLGLALGLFLKGMRAFRRDRTAILAASVGLARIGSIRVVQTPLVKGPLAFGIFDRVIAVPADFDRRFADGERRLALDHELSHHRSGDLIANFIAFVLLCLQWFNPLAWVAYAAFRFDQEAACDARVLDKANAGDRLDYGRAIAKAASGRALLFASALDRHQTLKRRLSSMLTNPTAGRRLAGRAMLLAAVAVALPLTATRAIDYVDPPMPVTSEVPASPALPAIAAVPEPVTTAAVAPLPAVPSAPPVPGSRSIDFHDGMVVIDGTTKRFSELTPAEKAKVRQSIAKARQAIARVHLDRDQIQHEVQQAVQAARIDKAELRRSLAAAQAEVAEAMRQVDLSAADIRRAGHDPETIKATIRTALKSVENIDIERVTTEALAKVDHAQIEASVSAAEQSVRAAEAELDRINAQDRSD